MEGQTETGQTATPEKPLSYWYQLVVLVFLGIAGLVLAADVLVPLAIASLLFVLLTAAVDRIGRVQIGGKPVPKWLAHVISLLLLVLGLLGLLSILSNQAGAVAEAFPKYEERFAAILARIITLVGDEYYQAVQGALADMDIAGFVTGAIGSAGGFLSAFFLVLLYIPFMMVERVPMRAKLALAAPDDQTASNLRRILESSSEGVQRYVGIKTSVSLLTGLGSYAVMKPVGLDFAETWAILAFALNFIPTIGSIVGVALPSLVALVQFDTLSPFLIVLAGCGVIQFSIGNVLEPALTGKSLNLSPLMVILALTFWTAIWGIPGALMSVPITVCSMIVLANIPATRPVAILMSGDGNLPTDSLEDSDPGSPSESNQTDNTGKVKLTATKAELEAEIAELKQQLSENKP